MRTFAKPPCLLQGTAERIVVVRLQAVLETTSDAATSMQPSEQLPSNLMQSEQPLAKITISLEALAARDRPARVVRCEF